MGNQLPNGKYRADNGKVFANYQDAVAATESIKQRRQLEREQRQTNNGRATHRQAIDQNRWMQDTFGWIPGARDHFQGQIDLHNTRLDGLNVQQRSQNEVINDYRVRGGERARTDVLLSDDGYEAAVTQNNRLDGVANDIDQKPDPSVDADNSYAGPSNAGNDAQNYLTQAKQKHYDNKEEGMAEWARLHPGLAKDAENKTDNPLMQSTFGYQTGDAPDQNGYGLYTGEDPSYIKDKEISSSRLSSALDGVTGPGRRSSNGVEGIGPIADGSQYGRNLAGTSGTEGIGPYASGDAYSAALGGGSNATRSSSQRSTTDFSVGDAEAMGMSSDQANIIGGGGSTYWDSSMPMDSYTDVSGRNGSQSSGRSERTGAPNAGGFSAGDAQAYGMSSGQAAVLARGGATEWSSDQDLDAYTDVSGKGRNTRVNKNGVVQRGRDLSYRDNPAAPLFGTQEVNTQPGTAPGVGASAADYGW